MKLVNNGKFELELFMLSHECFLTGTYKWLPNIAHDVDIVCRYFQREEVLGILKDETISLEDGKYNDCVYTKDSYRFGHKHLRINFIFLEKVNYLKWKKATELMSFLEVPTSRVQRHNIFEMLCAIEGMCNSKIKNM